MADSAVHVEGVVKRFGTTTALAGVDLDGRTSRCSDVWRYRRMT
jgi:ABC-type sugar transport system ATPase subunit